MTEESGNVDGEKPAVHCSRGRRVRHGWELDVRGGRTPVPDSVPGEYRCSRESLAKEQI